MFITKFSGDYIKFHTVFPDSSEIIDEYNMNSYEIESRRVKGVSKTGKENWVTEIGEEVFHEKESFIIKESSTNKNVSIFFITSQFLFVKIH